MNKCVDSPALFDFVSLPEGHLLFAGTAGLVNLGWAGDTVVQSLAIKWGAYSS